MTICWYDNRIMFDFVKAFIYTEFLVTLLLYNYQCIIIVFIHYNRTSHLRATLEFQGVLFVCYLEYVHVYNMLLFLIEELRRQLLMR